MLFNYVSKNYVLVAFWTDRLSFITMNSFALQFVNFIDIKTSCQVIVLLLKINVITSFCSVSLLRIKF